MNQSKPSNEFGIWVKHCRKGMEMTQPELAKAIGITKVQISKIENGHSDTSLKTLRRMCRVFKTTYVVEGDE